MSDSLGLLVSPSELSEAMELPSLRVVDVRGTRTGYRLGHIPGSVYLPRELFFDTVDGVAGRLPAADRVVSDLEELGVGTDKTVVVYDKADGLWAARLFWVLEYFGHEDVHLLDGGFRAWKREGHRTALRVPDHPPARFELRIDPERYASTEWMLEALSRPEVGIVDARSPEEFSGAESDSRRHGHIPGAINVEWTAQLADEEETSFLPAERITEIYRSHGLDTTQPVVTYCQGGVRAAHTYFALRLASFTRVRMYDDSWEAWGNREDTPIERE